jgi:multisubunit Na+/H+ antiporter MnhC subunit
MESRPFNRLLVAGGIVTAAIGVYAASQSSREIRWDSVASMVIIGVGALMAIIGLGNLLQPETPAPEEELRREVLPVSMLPLVYGAFIVGLSLIAGLVAGHFLGRNAGFLTFIFAFIVTNLLFGLPLAIARPSYR